MRTFLAGFLLILSAFFEGLGNLVAFIGKPVSRFGRFLQRERVRKLALSLAPGE